MKIYLMRHGETDWNKEKRLQGQSDIPLNSYGIELAGITAEALADIPFDRAFSSPLDRAYRTAEIVKGSRNILLTTDGRLREISFGCCEGVGFAQAKEEASHPLHDFFCRPECYVPAPGAESFKQVRARGRQFLEEEVFPLEGTFENILIVAHGAFNRCILNDILEIPDSEFWKIGLPNCAVSVLSVQQGHLSVLEESRIYYDDPANARP